MKTKSFIPAFIFLICLMSFKFDYGLPGPEKTKCIEPDKVATNTVTVEDSSHDITYKEAYTLISNFLGKETFRTLAQESALGGTIPLTGFGFINTEFNKTLKDRKMEPIDLDVKNFYPCYDRSATKLKKVFLCYTPYTVENTQACGCGFKANNPIYKFNNTFNYTGNVGADDIKSFLDDQSVSISYKLDTASKDDVLVWTHDFMDKFKVDPTSPTPDQGKICGYFETSDWLRMIKQYENTPYKIVAVNYYFGYDSTRETKVRIILIGVYSDPTTGHPRNLTVTPPGQPNPPLIMEKAWPPDNCISKK
jgi:hypothetical protein